MSEIPGTNKMTKKLIVGLTGSFGTGKTTVSHMFEELGACVVDADFLAREAFLNEEVQARLARLFPEAKTPEGFDRKKIAAVVFKNEAMRKELEGIIHPYVFDRMEDAILEAEEPVIILDVPLLFETGFNKRCDRTIAVSAPPEKIRERLKSRGYDFKETEARAKAQWSPEKKQEKANYVINNSGNLDLTRREVEKVWKDLRPVSKGEK